MNFSIGLLTVFTIASFVIITFIVNENFSLKLKSKAFMVIGFVAFVFGGLLQGYWDQCSSQSEIGIAKLYDCTIG
jgi:hypothetical protein